MALPNIKSPKQLDEELNTASELVVIKLGLWDDRILSQPGRHWVKLAFALGAKYGIDQFSAEARKLIDAAKDTGNAPPT